MVNLATLRSQWKASVICQGRTFSMGKLIASFLVLSHRMLKSLTLKNLSLKRLYSKMRLEQPSSLINLIPT